MTEDYIIRVRLDPEDHVTGVLMIHDKWGHHRPVDYDLQPAPPELDDNQKRYLVEMIDHILTDYEWTDGDGQSIIEDAGSKQEALLGLKKWLSEGLG